MRSPRPQRFVRDSKHPPAQSFGFGKPSLLAIEVDQPGGGESQFHVLLAMLLASEVDVLLGARNSFRELSLAVEEAHLCANRGKIIGSLRMGCPIAGGHANKHTRQ
jgi:hypothetical protein